MNLSLGDAAIENYRRGEITKEQAIDVCQTFPAAQPRLMIVDTNVKLTMVDFNGAQTEILDTEDVSETLE